MKYVVLILLVLVGVFLYKRAKRLATQEQQTRSERTDAGQTAASEPVAEAPRVEEVAAAATVEEKIQASEAPSVEPIVEPEVAPVVEPVTEVKPEPKVEAVKPDAEPEAAVEPAVVVEAEPLVEEPEPAPVAEPTPVAAAGLAVPGFAGDALAKAIREYNAAGNDELKHQGLLGAINECYKQRKDAAHLDFGASMADDYARLAIKVLGLGKPLKGVGFMQLATLLNDKGDFDGAIDICRQALDHGLSDGTVTGFEGRITRIEKARDKAAG